MSHEFRTPLNAILGFSEMIKSEYFGPIDQSKYKGYADDIYKSGEHMLALVNDVLDFSALEAGKRTLWREPVRLAPLLDECIRTFYKVSSDKGIDLALTIPERLPEAYVDRRAIKQVVLNLLSNAIKFVGTGGRVELTAEEDKNVLTIAVADNGIGISKDELERITEPFSQARTEATLAQEGTGLGLSIVKSLVEAHGGALLVESELGQGTTVTVQLPNVEHHLQQESDGVSR